MTTFRSTATDPGAPGYPERSGQVVAVVAPVRDVDAESGPMFRVRFPDGVETDAFADELSD